MGNSNNDQLENELQELYILAKHWFVDLDFLREELQFFKNVLGKFSALSRENAFEKKLFKLEAHLNELRSKIPEFLAFLTPFITNPDKTMDLKFLESYNLIADELRQLFSDVKATKKELFADIESSIALFNQ